MPSWKSAAVCFALLSAAPSARAGGPPLEASLSCESARAPGRVRCTLRISAAGGPRLDWADALVLETPAFARALLARVAARDVQAGQGTVKVPLALVLEGPGRGVVRVRARAVLCRADAGRERCFPATRDTEVELIAER
jgi:hypothetical protein